MFCSTIIPTIGRPTLDRAISSVLEQSFVHDDFEIIIVNDSGSPLPRFAWASGDRVSVLNTNRRERSVARNTGAAVATGKYLHFLDDDDWILPNALNAFWEMDRSHSAKWLYGSYNTVDNDGNIIEEIHPRIEGNIFALFSCW